MIVALMARGAPAQAAGRPGGATGAGALAGAQLALVSVPHVVDLTSDSASKVLAARGLTPRIVTERGEPEKVGLVIRQEPATDARVRRGAQVAIYVGSASPPPTAVNVMTLVDPAILVPTRLIKVPDVVGLESKSAVLALRDTGLTPVNGTNRYSDVQPRGQVVHVDPEPGTLVARGSRVSIDISLGPNPRETSFRMPRLVDRPLVDALAVIAKLSMSVGHVDSVPAPGAAGIVVWQSPASDTPARRDGAVDLRVAVAPTPVEIPQVVGLQLNEADSAIRAAGLTTADRVETTSDPDVAHGVVRQRPAPPGTAPRGTSVHLTVNTPPQVDSAVVPQLVGLSSADASAALKAAVLRIGNVLGGTLSERDTVASQSPASGTRVPMGSRVDFTISIPATDTDDPEILVEVPSVLGASLDVARHILSAAGLNTVVQTGSTSAGAKVNGQSPAAGAFIHADSAITLAMLDNAIRFVPDLRQLSVTDARALARAAGFEMRERPHTSGLHLFATVVAQTPDSGTVEFDAATPIDVITVEVEDPSLPPLLLGGFALGALVTGGGRLRRWWGERGTKSGPRDPSPPIPTLKVRTTSGGAPEITIDHDTPTLLEARLEIRMSTSLSAPGIEVAGTTVFDTARWSNDR